MKFTFKRQQNGKFKILDYNTCYKFRIIKSLIEKKARSINTKLEVTF